MYGRRLGGNDGGLYAPPGRSLSTEGKYGECCRREATDTWGKVDIVGKNVGGTLGDTPGEKSGDSILPLECEGNCRLPKGLPMDGGKGGAWIGKDAVGGKGP